MSGPTPLARKVADQAPGPGGTGPDQASQADQVRGPERTTDHPDQERPVPGPEDITSPAVDIDVAAVTAYRDNLRAGEPLSERKLAEMFGQTSRRWARNRMSEARQSPAAA
jgi:hypothetical protein